MLLKYQSTDANFKFYKASHIESVPIELLTLVNFIVEGVGFSKEPSALAQAMMFNFCFNMDEKRQSLKKKMHDQSKETPFPLYVAIKIYSHSRSKTMINWLYFCAGILHQYKHDGVFIPCNLKKNIVTIIAKDKIDHNARSRNTTMEHPSLSFNFHL